MSTSSMVKALTARCCRANCASFLAQTRHASLPNTMSDNEVSLRLLHLVLMVVVGYQGLQDKSASSFHICTG